MSDKSQSSAKYKIIRISTGETLIAGLSRDKNSFILQRPMVISTETIFDKAWKVKKTTIMLKTWIEYSSDEFYFLPRSMIVTFADPDSDVLAMYTEAMAREDSINKKMALSNIKSGMTSHKLDADEEYDRDMKNPDSWQHKPRFNID
jgi:hypothetical protein